MTNNPTQPPKTKTIRFIGGFGVNDYSLFHISLPTFYNGRMAFIYQNSNQNYGNLIENAEKLFNDFIHNDEEIMVLTK